MPTVNNDYYHHLGEGWYTVDNDPVAVLRAEQKLKNPWVLKSMVRLLGPGPKKVLDVGCGGGFLSNDLARHGHQVTGIDLCASGLEVAGQKDLTNSVQYICASAYEIPMQDASFDVLCCMDFLEHVEDPERVVRECSRLLKPGGVFFFHTFNRNFWSWLIVIKFMEWFMPNTPDHLHVLHLFIKPSELESMMLRSDLEQKWVSGIRPRFMSRGFWRSLLLKRVTADFEFAFKPSLKLGYIGYAIKRI